MENFWAVPLFSDYSRLRSARSAFDAIVAALHPPADRSPARPRARTLLELSDPAHPAPAGARERVRARLRALVAVRPPSWLAGLARGMGRPVTITAGISIALAFTGAVAAARRPAPADRPAASALVGSRSAIASTDQEQ